MIKPQICQISPRKIQTNPFPSISQNWFGTIFSRNPCSIELVILRIMVSGYIRFLVTLCRKCLAMPMRGWKVWKVMAMNEAPLAQAKKCKL